MVFNTFNALTTAAIFLNVATVQGFSSSFTNLANQVVPGENTDSSFWQAARNATQGEEIPLSINGTDFYLCADQRTVMKPEFDLVDILVNGLPADKNDLFGDSLTESMWLEGRLCGNPGVSDIPAWHENSKFVVLATPSSTKGSFFMNGTEYLLEEGMFEESSTLADGLKLEDHDAELSDAEQEVLNELIVANGGRRSMDDSSLSPGEVDLFVLVDINYDIVEALGEADSVTYALNLFSWINENVYFNAGFNLQVSEINLRTESCGSSIECLASIRANGQPSNAHLVHHMHYTGQCGYGAIAGLYTNDDWNGVSRCPAMKGNFGLWERICVAHELGHNLGGIHTHDMGIDTCGDVCSNGGEMNVEQGTIMSYCHQCSGGYFNIDFEFHELQLTNKLWPIYHNRQSKMNVVADGTVGLDLSTLEPWVWTSQQPYDPNRGNTVSNWGNSISSMTSEPTYAATSASPTFMPTEASTTETPTMAPTDVVVVSTNSPTRKPTEAEVVATSAAPTKPPTRRTFSSVGGRMEIDENDAGMIWSLFWATSLLLVFLA